MRERIMYTQSEKSAIVSNISFFFYLIYLHRRLPCTLTIPNLNSMSIRDQMSIYPKKT